MRVYEFLTNLYKNLQVKYGAQDGQNFCIESPEEWWYAIMSLEQSALKDIAVATLYFNGINCAKDENKGLEIIKDSLKYEHFLSYRTYLKLNDGKAPLCNCNLFHFLPYKEVIALYDKVDVLELSAKNIHNYGFVELENLPQKSAEIEKFLERKKIKEQEIRNKQVNVLKIVMDSQTNDEFKTNLENYIGEFPLYSNCYDSNMHEYRGLFVILISHLASHPQLYYEGFFSMFLTLCHYGWNCTTGEPDLILDTRDIASLIEYGCVDSDIKNLLHHLSHETDITNTYTPVLCLYEQYFRKKGLIKVADAYYQISQIYNQKPIIFLTNKPTQ